MNLTRATAYGLLLLDVVISIVVFNVVASFRDIRLAEHLILTRLTLPIAALVFAIYLIEGYRARTDMLSVNYASQHAIAMLGAMIATLLLTFVVLTEGFELQSSRAVIAVSFLALIPLTIGYRRLIYQAILQSRGERSLVFLGDRASCEAFRAECRKMATTQQVVYSVVTEESIAPLNPIQAIAPQ